MDKEYILKCNLEKKLLEKEEEPEEKEIKKKDTVEDLDLNDDSYKPKYRKRRYNEIFYTN